jgi:predicted kinase
MIIIVFGLPGSGKSFFASRLALKLGGPYISTDEIRMKLFSRRTYSDEEKLAVYDAMLEVMTKAIPDHKPIVLDGTFFKESLRNKFEQRAADFNEKIIYIEVTTTENLMGDRLKKPRPYSEADYDVYLKLRKEAEPLQKDHLVLTSTDTNIFAMLSDAADYIDRHK